MANGEVGFNLGLNSKGDGNLGLGTSIASAPVPASAINPIAADIPAAGSSNQGIKDVIAASLLAFNANDPTVGLNAATQAQGRRAQADQLKKTNLIRSMQLGTSLAASASSLPADKRDLFIKSTVGTLTEGGEGEAAKLFQSLASKPDHQVAIGGLEDTPIGKQILAQDPTGKALVDFATSPQGQQALDNIADKTITPGAFQKIQGITGTLDKLSRDGHIDKTLLERVQADGKISIPEIQQLAESMPEGHPLKLAPEELSAATAERNMETLRTVGISLAEDFEPKEQKLQAKDNIVDDQGNFVGIGILDPQQGMLVQVGDKLRPLKAGERSVDTSGSLEDTGLTKRTVTDLQSKLVSTTAASDRIAGTIKNFDEKFLTIGGKAKMAALGAAEKAGLPLSDDFKAELAQFTEFKSGALADLNLYIKEITGAAMTVSEAERLRKTMPDPENDSPTEFLTKLNKTYNETLIVRQRAMSALDQGLPDATSIPLSEIKAQIADGTLPQKRFDSLIEKGLSQKRCSCSNTFRVPRRITKTSAAT